MKIAVLMGGISSEREISLRTGEAILNALINKGYDAFKIDLNRENIIDSLRDNEYDLAFIALHGEYGEDGRIQALLDILGKKYTGSGFTQSAISMDKDFTKKILISENILMSRSYKNVNEIKKYPVVIKPATEGSSIGLYICNNESDAKEAIENLRGKKLVIEEFIKGEEITVGVFEGEALGVIKIKPKSGLYDYKSKYTKGETEFEVPANIGESLYKKAMDISEKIYKILELDGGIRVDMILSEGKLYFLEVNTIPGMTETSLLPQMAKLKGYDFDDFVKKMVQKFAKI
ncbi:MAG: D-alanine--D-alanine ligase [Fusobacteria bacterium]|nr:D-alanine--D-alanine ligase [Fusobacteriota bacterium]